MTQACSRKMLHRARMSRYLLLTRCCKLGWHSEARRTARWAGCRGRGGKVRLYMLDLRECTLFLHEDLRKGDCSGEAVSGQSCFGKFCSRNRVAVNTFGHLGKVYKYCSEEEPRKRGGIMTKGHGGICRRSERQCKDVLSRERPRGF